jgi:putative ABC transport system permease protein
MIKLAFRNLWRNPLYSSLNITGLVLGMASVMLIALWVQNELRYDRYHKRADGLWRVTTDLKLNADETWHWGTTPLRLNELAEQIPGVISVSRILNHNTNKLKLRRGGDLFQEEKYAYVDPKWFETFDYEFSEGSAAGFFEHPNQLMLTEQTALKIFGRHSALGASLRIDSTEYVVHAVLKDPRNESSFHQNILFPLEAYLNKAKNRQNDMSWSNFNYCTFLELQPQTDPKAVADQLTQLLAAAKQDSNITMNLIALKDLHFDQSLTQDNFVKGNKNAVFIFGLIGLLILLMAAMNYVSLTTARAGMRARETGIHKVVGAGKWQLFMRYLSESAVVAFIAGILSIGLVQMILPGFNRIADNHFVLQWDNPLFWGLAGGAMLSTLLLAGVYPALVLANFKPIGVLRANVQIKSGQKSLFRQGLVVAQFVVSVSLLICTIVIAQQREFILKSDMGYSREHVFSFQFDWNLTKRFGLEKARTVIKSMSDALRQTATVANVSLTDQLPMKIESSHSGSVKYEGMAPDAEPTVSQVSVDAQYAKLMGLKMAAGRWFEPDNTSDQNNFVLNETALRKLGIKEPAVGQSFEIYSTKGQIIGVVRDFHFKPLTEIISPLVLYHSPSYSSYFLVKAQPGKAKEAVAAAEKIWKSFVPDQPFEATFLDETFEKQYRREERAGLLFNIFAGIAIFISCLGLFGLATFMAVQRTKEIGVRKVLGASVAGLVALLTRDFLKLVLISIVIATPIAWYAMQKWLTDFAYRIEMQWWMFALAGAAAITVAIMTVGVQSIKAALRNPVKSLRNE